ncbi:related to nasopharyngeal carcinoma susceptibility protein LZ16 [Rhynchosporium secalis]|uniref:Related to nasopharyngeal carcinoma susceptibility protein LZ16 n=1 Tax=Rhynchosporium secalis TaxID=38038 RepID=A0A1E1MJE2_RHYSE|nr:related to nasopharyngeal carcinoma susceptibility protein LZ16 [Rhynchosporium secalis]
MAALHDALKSLGPLEMTDTPVDDMKPFLRDAFSKGQLLVDSVPMPGVPEGVASPEGRSHASSTASSASDISLSHARSDPPNGEVAALRKEWKTVKLNAKDNPLGMSVYKLGGKDGKGTWFARRSVHEGLGFTKWKKGLEREFPETLKVQGGPGEGNIRGIGGERRVEYLNAEGVGKVEVYLLSAQFPGPTAPRDFVTMVITSDQALSDTSGGDKDVPRHFMVISRPCCHPDAPPREGYIRGQYESVEFIREIPIHKIPKKSSSTSNLPATRNRATSTLSRDAILRNAKQSHSSLNGESDITAVNDVASLNHEEPKSEARARGKTISFDMSRGSDAKGENMDIPREDDESECNPIEWIMITRSDPGGSVPRFLIDRGTPAGIVSDATKFLDWACAKDITELESDDRAGLDANGDVDKNTQSHQRQKHDHDRDLHNFQTNGHLVGIEEAIASVTETSRSHALHEKPQSEPNLDQGQTNGGLYGMVVGVAGAAGGFIAAHTPAVISSNLPRATEETSIGGSRRDSLSSISSDSSAGTFASAMENYGERGIDAASFITTESSAQQKATALQDRELQKLEEKKRRLDEKLSRTREKELSKKSDDSVKEEEAIRKAEERHEREKKKQEEKYKREVEKLERRKEKEERKAEDRRKKAAEKDEKSRLLQEVEELKVEVSILKKEKEILRGQVGDLQAENTCLAARVGKLGPQGEEVLKDVRAEVGRTGRLRAGSLKGLTRSSSFRSSSSGEKSVENTSSPCVTSDS